MRVASPEVRSALTIMLCTGTNCSPCSLQLTVSHRIENGIFHVDIVSIAPVTTIKDHFGMTWEDENHSDKIWGKCLRKSRMINPETFIMEGEGSEEDKSFLMAKKLKDSKTDSRFLDDQLVHVWCVPLKGDWSAEMVWGFEEVEGERHYTRRAVVKNGEKVERVRLVYDYLGPSH
jgi:hypothetical protein